MVSQTVLQIFDPKKEILIQCDASKQGLGACSIQGNKPVMYASRSLNETDQRYAQIEKEMLAIVFAFNKFQTVIYGN